MLNVSCRLWSWRGHPSPRTNKRRLRTALASDDEAAVVETIQRILDPLCLVGVTINPESRVKVQDGAAPQELMQQGWRTFLVKVHNQAGVTAPLRCTSPNAEPMHDTWINRSRAAANDYTRATSCSVGLTSACTTSRH